MGKCRISQLANLMKCFYLRHKNKNIYIFSTYYRYKLPEALPYSLDGRYGRIEYKSKAEVIVPGINPVESLEEEFFILSKESI